MGAGTRYTYLLTEGSCSEITRVCGGDSKDFLVFIFWVTLLFFFIQRTHLCWHMLSE